MHLGKQLGNYFKSFRGNLGKQGSKASDFWNLDLPMSDYSNDSTGVSDIHFKQQKPSS